MKKFILGGLFAVLFSLSIGVTTVYAEDTETNGTVSEMESVVDDSVDETITSEEISVGRERCQHSRNGVDHASCRLRGLVCCFYGGNPFLNGLCQKA